MIKKYKYLFIAILLVLLTPIITHKTNDSISVFNKQQNQYENFVEVFLREVREIQDENPISISSFESKGEEYVYKSLLEREKVLDKYTYTEDMVPDEYVDIHRQIVEFITIYRDGINTAKQGILLLNRDIGKEGISRIIDANKLLVKINEDFLKKQGY